MASVESSLTLTSQGVLVAPLWTPNHTTANGNYYKVGTLVNYEIDGVLLVHKCIADNDSIVPTNTTYWINLGPGYIIPQEKPDWNAIDGDSQILNKPDLTGYITDAPNDGSQYVRKNESWDKLTTYSAVDPVSTNNVAEGFPLGSDWYNTVTGEKFYQKANGVWISYTASTTPPIDTGDSPVMFADYATQTFLPNSPIYYNGPLDDGVGATLTASSDGKLFGPAIGNINLLDPLLYGQTLLVKDELQGDFESGTPGDRFYNGVYIVTNEGSNNVIGVPDSPWVLTRVDYADEPSELFPSQVNILSGPNQNRFFLQQNVINAIGDTEIVYEINYVPPTQVVTLPVIHMDTATTEPLPSCTYTDEFPSGIFSFSPTTSYLTATTNGPLGIINGVNVSNFFAVSNRRILVKNQVDPIQNGDYEIIQNGTATGPWKLRRITTNYSSFNKNTREWKINNEASTLYGNRYYMNYNPGGFGIVGSNPITFSELVAGGIQNLQDVTDVGNTTDNDIQFGTGAGVYMNNGSRLKEGSIDAGYGGSKGIAQICAVGYELKWEAGRLYVMGDGGTTVREVSHNFTTIPNNYNDISQGFIVGSRWLLDDGTLYVCTDNTDDAAVWELQVTGAQDLQSVTTIGNITTTEIISESGLIVNSADIPDSAAYLAKLGIFSILQSGTLRYGGSFELRETSVDGSGNVVTILPSVLTEDRLLYLPNKNGTLAVTTDLPTQYLTSANVDANIGERLKPADAASNGFYFNKSFNGSVGYTALNTNTGNSAVVNLGVGIDSSSYIKNIYVAKFGPNYFVPLLAGKGGLLGTEEVFVGSTDNNDVSILTGVDFSSVSRKFTVKANGQLLIQTTPSTGTTSDFLLLRDTSGNVKQIAFPEVPTKTSDLINDGDNGTTHFISLQDLPSNLVLYATNVASGISTYTKAVLSITDPDYNTTAVDIPTGALTSTTVPKYCGGIVSPANVIIGNPGIFTMSTIGQIRRTAGSAEGTFFYEVYKRTSAGVETLIIRSADTVPISAAIYTEFQAAALFNNGVFTDTDRIVIKFYGLRLAGGSDPSFDFQFGGTIPVRTTLPVPLTVVPANGVTSVAALTLGTTGTDLSSTVANETSTPVITLNVPTASATNRGALSSADWSTFNEKQDPLYSGVNIKTINGNSVLGSGNIVISSGGGGVPLTRQEFTYSGSQNFTLLANPSYTYGVFVNGQELNSSQYSITTNVLTILNTLQIIGGIPDSVNIVYGETAPGILDYYTKAQVDTLIANATPDINIVNATKITLMYNT
jgi:hypothetical protein